MRKVVVSCAIVIAVASLGCRRRHRVPQVVEAEPVAAAPEEAPAVPEHIPAPPPPPGPVAAEPVAIGTRVVAEMPDGGTANGDPRGPRADALNKVVQSTMPELQRCLDGVEEMPTGRDLELRIKYAIDPSGRTSGVQVSGPVPAPGAACVKRAVENMKFPEFGGPPVAGDFPFSYRRDVK